MSFTPFQKFLPKAAAHYGVKKEIEAAQICQHFRALTPELFKKLPDAKNYVSPAHYQNRTLTLRVPNSAWAQEVIMRKPQIIEEMNKSFGKEVIRSLRTQLSA